MKFFNPAVKIMNKLRYPMKFLMIGILFFSFILWMAYVVITDIREEIAVMRERQTGAQYNLLLKDALQYVQQHRGLTVNIVGGDTSLTEQRDKAQQNVDTALEQLGKFDETHTYDFKVDELKQQILEDWNQITSTQWQDAAEAIKVHSDLTNTIMEAMRIISNESELQLAVSKESNNLISAITNTMPMLTEQLGLIRANSMNVLNSGEMTEAQKDTITMLYYQISQNVDNVEQNFEMALMDHEINDQLSSIYEESSENLTIYGQQIEQLLENDLKNTTAEQFYKMATSSINMQFEVYDAGLTYLSDRLYQQQDHLENRLISIFSLIVLLIVVAIYIFTGLYLSIKRNVQGLMDVTSLVSEGDLTQKVNLQTNDEMQQVETAINAMIDNLQSIVLDISHSSQHVAASSEELHAGVEETTASITHVAGSVESMTQDVKIQMEQMSDTDQAMQEIAENVAMVASKTNDVFELTSDTTDFANEGSAMVHKNEQQMTSIQSSVNETSTLIEQLDHRSKEIGQIVTLITAISDQTNLLSLNAAIEAARAGEHGKGFAVVADEVRNLAAQSNDAAARVTQLIQAIQQDTERSVAMMEVVSENVDEGLQISQQTAIKFERILNNMNDLQGQMAEIRNNAHHMSSTTKMVTEAINASLHVSKTNASVAEDIANATAEQNASMEEMETSATELAVMSEQLQNLIGKFKL